MVQHDFLETLFLAPTSSAFRENEPINLELSADSLEFGPDVLEAVVDAGHLQVVHMLRQNDCQCPN